MEMNWKHILGIVLVLIGVLPPLVIGIRLLYKSAKKDPEILFPLGCFLFVFAGAVVFWFGEW